MPPGNEMNGLIGKFRVQQHAFNSLNQPARLNESSKALKRRERIETEIQ